MFFYYLLTAYGVILLSAFGSYLMMKRVYQAVTKNKIKLAICTVLAMVCATLTPLLANYLVNELYFSFILSLCVSLGFCIILAGGAFYLIQRVLAKQENQEVSEPIEERREESEKNESGEAAEIANVNNPEAESLIEAACLNETVDSSEETGFSEAVAFDGLLAPDLVDSFDQAPETGSLYLNVEDNLAEAGHASLPHLVEQALACKSNHLYYEAISFYEKALGQETDTKLLELIIIDLCALYKMTNQKELVYKILESDPYNLSDLEIREDILQNL